MYIPVEKDFRLNERMYGALAGLNKIETVEKHGKEQVSLVCFLIIDHQRHGFSLLFIVPL